MQKILIFKLKKYLFFIFKFNKKMGLLDKIKQGSNLGSNLLKQANSPKLAELAKKAKEA